jgi:hypothetical protein
MRARTHHASILLPLFLACGCAALSSSVIPIDGASPDDSGAVARITLANALLRAVDEKLIPGVQVPSALRSYTYVLAPGRHSLWVSSVPHGLPWLPQRISCYVFDVVLAPGSSYVLDVDARTEVAILSGSEPSGSPAIGVLVDKPFVMERSCRWR